MKLVIFAIITIIFLPFILPGVLSFGVINIPQNEQPSLDRTQKIYNELIVSQSFISKITNLSGIGMSLKNPNLSNKKDIVLSIYGEDGSLIRKAVLNGKNISDGKFVKFKFEPITASQNKQFVFTLTSPATSKEEADRNEALEVFLSGEDVSFVSFSKPLYPTYVLERIYSNWMSKLTADWQFFIVYVVSILILIGSLLPKKLAKFLQHH